MALRVIPEDTRIADHQGVRAGIVCVESDAGEPTRAIEELQGMEARTLALRYASEHGVTDPRINGSPGYPYPVDPSGKNLEDVFAQSVAAGQDPAAVLSRPYRYRVRIPVTSRLV